MTLATETIILLSRAVTGQDAYGNDVTTTTEIPIHRCLVHPRMSAEGSVEARQQVTTGLWVHAPAGVTIRPGDGVRRGGLDYEVDGDVGAWRTSSGSIARQQFALKRVTG